MSEEAVEDGNMAGKAVPGGKPGRKRIGGKVQVHPVPTVGSQGSKKEEEEEGGIGARRGWCARVSSWFWASSKDNERVWNLADCDLSLEEIEELKMVSVFTEREIKILRLRFKDKAGESEWLPMGHICDFKEVSLNPLKHRLAQCFETDGDGYVDFQEFVITLSHLSTNGTREKKLAIAFKIHDFDGDEKISKADLKEYLKEVTNFKKSESELAEDQARDREEVTAKAAESIQGRIEFNKQRVAELKQFAKKHRERVDEIQIQKHLARIKSLESEGILDRVVESTFDEASSDREFITRDEFIRVIGHSDFQGKLLVDFCDVRTK